MKGYKGMDLNMQCQGMQFEVGKSYHVDGQIIPCLNGLHFCEKLEDVFNYYERDGNRFFEIEASGDIRTAGNKKAASDIRIVKELSDVEINRTVYGYGNGNCDGHRYGDSNGYGNGYGNGEGYSYDGNGYGNGYGYGYSDCYDYGYGNGYSYGYGYGNGKSIQKILIFA